MTRRDFLLLGTLALLARAGMAILVADPPYLDPAYYELVARQLAAGEGFTTPALWSFLEVGGRLPDVPELPLPSNGHWMPLTSIVAAGSMALLGPSRLAAELPMVLIGAGLVPLTAFIGWDVWRSRRTAYISGVLALFAGPMLVFVPLTDSFALFGLGGFIALFGAMRAVQVPAGTRWLLLSAIGVSIATLTRIDGVILAIAPGVAWLIRRGIGPWSVELRPLPWAAAGGCIIAALVLLAPWLIRQQLVFGTPLPSAGGHTLWITSYNEQFSIGHPVTPATYLASGVPAILGSKLESWGLLIGRTAVLLGGAFVLSFAFGLWRERPRAALAPFIAYWITLFAVMGGLFTFHGPQGAWYHSAWAWLPFALPLAVASFQPGLAGLGRRLAIFSRPRNQRFLLAAATAGAIALSLIGSASLVVDWQADRARLRAVEAFFETAASPNDVVMAVDPPSLTLATGLRSLAPPYDPFPVIAKVVRAYEVRWVVVEIDTGSTVDPLGLWNGSASTDGNGNRATFLADVPSLDVDDVRVYEVVQGDR